MLEVLLVLVIIATFVMGGIQFYQLQDQNLQVKLLVSNINFIFTRLANYYLVNCRNNLTADMLSPKSVSLTDLKIDTNQLFSSSLVKANTYTAQLKRLTTNQTNVAANTCVIIANGTPCTTYTKSYTQPSTATDMNWQFTVGVQLGTSDENKISQYQLLTGANRNGTDGNLYWDRSLSAIFFTGAKVLSPSLLLLQQFGAQYTHNQYYELNNNTWNLSGQDPNYYRCGG